jgi:hypothetical protein
MKRRLIVIGIDDICALFRDYCYMNGFPVDAKCSTLLMNPATRRMRLRVTSEEWSGEQPPEQIRFDLHRTYLAGVPNGRE